MPRPKTLHGPQFTLRLTDRQDILLGEVQVHTGLDRASAARWVLNACIEALQSGKPLGVLIPIDMAPLLKKSPRRVAPLEATV